jgi:hypothetical protein
MLKHTGICLLAFILTGCRPVDRPPVELEVKMEYKLKHPAGKVELESFGFTDMSNNRELESFLYGHKIFQPIKDSMAGHHFDFTQNNYLITFGKEVSKMNYKPFDVLECDKKSTLLHVFYKQGITDTVYFYLLPKNPRLSPECD